MIRQEDIDELVERTIMLPVEHPERCREILRQVDLDFARLVTSYTDGWCRVKTGDGEMEFSGGQCVRISRDRE